MPNVLRSLNSARLKNWLGVTLDEGLDASYSHDYLAVTVPYSGAEVVKDAPPSAKKGLEKGQVAKGAIVALTVGATIKPHKCTALLDAGALNNYGMVSHRTLIQARDEQRPVVYVHVLRPVELDELQACGLNLSMVD